MKLNKVIKAARKFAKPYAVTGSGKFRLKDFDPGDTGTVQQEDKPLAKEALQTGVEGLAELQSMLYAQDRWSLLLVFQAMDAAGKDGAIKHVMSGVNPQGCQVVSFKSPSAEELDHDYLWRCNRNLPERGRIGIFNRSYYEEVLVLRVHQQLLENQKVPAGTHGQDIWEERFRDIRAYERYLDTNGVIVRKSFSTCRTPSRSVASSIASTIPRRTGNSLRPMPANAATGMTTWRPTRRPSATLRRRNAPGMSCRRTTSGTRVS